MRTELRIKSISVWLLAKDKRGSDAKSGAQSDVDKRECDVFGLFDSHSLASAELG